MEVDQDQVSKRIFYLMQALGTNQKSFARLLGVTQPAISKYLKDRIPPSIVLLKLAQAAGTSIEWILTGQADIRNQKIREPEAAYETTLSIEQKVSRLPIPFQAGINTLIDAIIENSGFKKNGDLG